MIAIYTPIASASAIGRVNATIADELVRRGVAVTLVRCEHPGDRGRAGPIHPTTAALDDAARYDRNPAAFAAGFDAVFYSLGDQHSFHYYAIKHAFIHPGITILHDICMLNALYGYCGLGADGLSFREVTSSSYGDAVGEEIDAAIENRTFAEWFKRAMELYPTFEWALIRAQGCLTHSRFAADAVRTSTGLIVAATPLPLVRHTSVIPSDVPQGGRARIVTIGHINDNKRAQSVAAVVGRSRELRARCEYHVVGPVEPEMRAQIERAAGADRGSEFLTFHGRVDDATLDALLASAQIACCLRWPAMEAGSLSCIEAMACGLPTVVTDTGVYSEMPDECVVKIDPAREMNDLEDALLQLVRSPERRAAIGAAGKAYVTKNHTAGRYADDLLRLTADVLAARPVLGVLDQLGSAIADLGIDPSSPVVPRVAQAIDTMFGGKARAGGTTGARGIT